MVRYARRLEDDENFDDYDPRYFPKKVFKDGRGPKVHLMLTDAAAHARRPVFDARNHMPHQARVTDAARQRVEDAYEAMCARNESAWLWRKEHVRAPAAVNDSPRDAWIKRQATDWQRGAPRYDLDPYRSPSNTALLGRSTAGPVSAGPDSSFEWNASTASQYRTPRPPDDDDDDNGLDMTATDPEAGDDGYTRGVWSAQNAIDPVDPEGGADDIDALQRRMTMNDPRATRASVRAERQRYRPRDAATAQAIKDEAYAEYCERISNAWRNP
jgi:hypothetical protein